MVEREGARALAQLAAVLPTAAEAGGSPREDLLAALRGYLEAVSADPVTWRLVLMPPEGAPPVLRERITAGRDAVVAALAERRPPGSRPGHRVARPAAHGAHALGGRRRGRPAAAHRPRGLPDRAPRGPRRLAAGPARARLALRRPADSVSRVLIAGSLIVARRRRLGRGLRLAHLQPDGRQAPGDREQLGADRRRAAPPPRPDPGAGRIGQGLRDARARRPSRPSPRLAPRRSPPRARRARPRRRASSDGATERLLASPRTTRSSRRAPTSPSCRPTCATPRTRSRSPAASTTTRSRPTTR